jgi:hypothetical protein
VTAVPEPGPGPRKGPRFPRRTDRPRKPPMITPNSGTRSWLRLRKTVAALILAMRLSGRPAPHSRPSPEKEGTN